MNKWTGTYTVCVLPSGSVHVGFVCDDGEALPFSFNALPDAIDGLAKKMTEAAAEARSRAATVTKEPP